ncbi:tyrosine-type recombinase/integrase [Shewanella eurypsychrophilus]|uniref:Tyrosine-type recombinase/integrase n=1 Tax=Shewanella eurypsychrophilus TaxID=2593656 RepID=A0ABX6V0W3_9GAMM|nr:MULTISPECIES: tyrosine-type recombinase/integrase [Shewanella]QFU20693.1 tyrosine-type recombinase/integrase [Shewanella sp. YLB-09]QFU20973.1 tyrosine-type recombinase/integrase [Shewanella sp. YLB-09]QPG56261.1 tyrosine-type recombinase/integrase [Shewanella eurypsychrophilus]
MPRVHSARDRDEFQVILNSLENRRGFMARCLAELTALWALRISDILAITTRQIDESFDTGEFSIIEGKTQKVKVITLTPHSIKLLNKMRLEAPNNTYLFESRYGGERRPLSRKTAWRWMDEVESDVIRHRRSCGRLGGVNLGTHSLRKSGSRLRQQVGCTLEELQQLLNHSKPDTTINYLDNNEQDLVDTFIAGDEALFGDVKSN